MRKKVAIMIRKSVALKSQPTEFGILTKTTESKKNRGRWGTVVAKGMLRDYRYAKKRWNTLNHKQKGALTAQLT